MSSAARCAVAAMPADIDVEILQLRLLELRAEIDAILTHLAGRRAAPAATEPEVAAVAAIAPESETEQLVCDLEAQPSVPAEADASMPAPEAADPPEASATPETEALPAAETRESDAPEPAAAIDMDLADHLADTDIETESVADAAVLPVVAATPAEPIIAEPIPTAAPATDGPQQAAAEVEQGPPAAAPPAAGPAGPAETRVLSFEPRHRKQKVGYAAATTTAARPRRRLAPKIAACIFALLAAATVLIVADRTAVVSAQSLPWMSPLPSYVPYGAAWPFFGQRQGTSSATDDGAASRRRSTTDDSLLMRYRKIWPSGT